MISTFRVKTQKTQGVDVDRPLDQAADIATLLQATSFSVDLAAGTASFSIDPSQDGEIPGRLVTVAAGQVVSVTAGVISVQSRDEFYSTFEEETPS